jgi:hypothetical protein
MLAKREHGTGDPAHTNPTRQRGTRDEDPRSRVGLVGTAPERVLAVAEPFEIETRQREAGRARAFGIAARALVEAIDRAAALSRHMLAMQIGSTSC